MADIQIGKNKYKVTLTILIGAFTILVSSIGWVLSLQMTVAATEKDIAELKLQLATIKEIEDEIDDVIKRQSVIENDMRSIMSEHSQFNEILREMGKAGYGDKREYGNYD
tara:strand:- start:460 stop:789 length:330 start_codon:yes stop_codon:yes gene_type:complete